MHKMFKQMESPWFSWLMTAVSAGMLYLYASVYESNVLEFWAWVTMLLVWSLTATYRTLFRGNS